MVSNLACSDVCLCTDFPRWKRSSTSDLFQWGSNSAEKRDGAESREDGRVRRDGCCLGLVAWKAFICSSSAWCSQVPGSMISFHDQYQFEVCTTCAAQESKKKRKTSDLPCDARCQWLLQPYPRTRTRAERTCCGVVALVSRFKAQVQ